MVTAPLFWKPSPPCRAWWVVCFSISRPSAAFATIRGWIRELLDEAENERMHLMAFIKIAQPSWLERAIILIAQGVFFNLYFLLYLVAPKTAHRVVGYLEEEAVISYTQYLDQVDNGTVRNVPAPQMAIDYWKLPADARLRELIIAVRADEAAHRDHNHGYAQRPAGWRTRLIPFILAQNILRRVRGVQNPPPFPSVHRFEVERRPLFDAARPARGHGLGAGVELERIRPVLVQIAKARFLPATKGMVGQRHRDRHV